jgi:flagellar protein FliO/FliZ
LDWELISAIVRLIIFLPLVLLLAYYVVKRGWGSRYYRYPNSQMQIVDRIFIGPKQCLSVVKLLDRFYLVAVSEQQIQLLKELADYPITNGPELSEDFLVSGVKKWLAGMAQKAGNKK